MLQLWIGRAGAGKSRRCVDAIAQNRRHRRQLLLVPEHTSHEAEVDLCRALGDTAGRDAEVLTFRSLATRVLSQTGGLSDFTLDNGGKILTLRRCLQELSASLTVFARPSRRSAFLEQLMKLFDEFGAYAIAPDTLMARVADLEGTAGDKLRDVALLYAAYDARLHAEGFDHRSRMQKLADALPGSDYLDGADLYVDGFSLFNAQEERVLRHALLRCHSVTVTLLGDKYDATLFGNAVRERERLVRLAREAGAACEIQYLTARMSGPLGHLEQHLFGEETAWPEETDAVTIYRADTAYSEVEWVASAIRRLAMQGVRYRDIGVACRRMEDYGALIREVFRRCEIPAYVSVRSDILEKPAITMLTSALDAVTGGFGYQDMFRCLKTGMAGITAGECDVLENYVIAWNIRGTTWIRDEDWAAHPGGYGLAMDDHYRAQLDAVNAIHRKVRAPFAALHHAMTEEATAREKAAALYRFAQQTHVPETLRSAAEQLAAAGNAQTAAEYRQIWEIFCGVLDQFVEILGDTAVDGEEFARLLRLVLTQYSVGTIPATLDQVKVSEITRNDRHNVRYMFLLGANDSVLPLTEHRTGILDREDRQTLQQREIRLSDHDFDQLDNELQNIYACLVQPTEGLFVTYPTLDEKGVALLPSFVVRRLEKLFPRGRRLQEDGSYRLEMPATALEAAGEQMGSPLWQHFAADPAFAGVCRAMALSSRMDRGSLSPEAVRALYGREMPMSASRIDKIKACHFAYFLEYGLKARERKSADFDASQVGTFIHFLLEHVARDARERGGFAALDSDALPRMVDRYIEEYTASKVGDLSGKSARFRYLFLRLRDEALVIVESLVEELRNSDFQPLAFELGFGGSEGELPAIRVADGDTALSVTGQVDRVDTWEKDGKLYLRVVDYKTGKKDFRLTDVRYGRGIQMLLYLFALQQQGERYFGKPVVPAGVLYHPANDPLVSMDRNSSDEDIRAARMKEQKHKGLLLNDVMVLDAMEHGAPAFAKRLPVGMKSDGTLTGSLATAEQLGRLSRHVDRVLRDIAGELRRGDISVDPCVFEKNKDACTYCPYRAVCCFDEQYDAKRYMQKTDSKAFWEMLKEREEEEHGHNAD